MADVLGTMTFEGVDEIDLGRFDEEAIDLFRKWGSE
jgi:hypothetical protein